MAVGKDDITDGWSRDVGSSEENCGLVVDT